MENIVTVLPNASSLLESMRSIGYSFETALADIIDNSISANAKEIMIYQRQSDGRPYIQILDNGFGMNNHELIEAMRLGSKSPIEKRSATDLGRFGLGLKSASFSQCKKLTVISKTYEGINGYEWDLDWVRESNKFAIKMLSERDIQKIPNISQLESMNSGTLVQWENFDRIQESTSDLQDELSELMNNSIEHISLIFHRFIDEGLKILVNFETILPKDPFLVRHSGTQELQSKKVRIDGETIQLYPYVIPHSSKMTASDKRKIGKVTEQYKSQGFYLYRNKRLIVWGDYLGLAKKTELGKNVRIRVDIPNSLDYLWEIDVKKSRASVPSKIKKNLISAISDGEYVSKNVNTYRGKKELTVEKPVWQFYGDRDDEFHFEINANNPMYQQFYKSLNQDQQKFFNIFTKTVEASIPFQAIYSQISSGKKNTVEVYQQDSLLESVKETITTLKETGVIDIDQFLRSLLNEEPYSSNEAVIKLINRELKQ